MDEKTIKELQDKAQADLQALLAQPPSHSTRPDRVRAERQLLILELVAARQAKKLSQTELAGYLGTQQSVIARIESGKTNPRLNTILEIARVLGVRLVVECQ